MSVEVDILFSDGKSASGYRSAD